VNVVRSNSIVARNSVVKAVLVSGYEGAGTADFYDAYGEREWLRLEAKAYGRLQAVIHRDFLREYVRPGQRVLDAGCGPGRFTMELVRLGARPVALDTSAIQLRMARDRCHEAGVEDQVEFLEGDIVDLTAFDDGSFDAVVCFGGPLSYVFDQRQMAAGELVRVTRPGGFLLVSAMSRFGATCNVVRRATLEILRDPVAGHVEAVLGHGDLSGMTSRVSGRQHPPMHLYTSDELAELFQPCEVLAVAGSNVTAVEGDPLLEDVAADAAAWSTTVEIERRLCRQPGLVDTGSHLIVVARRPS
jgi:ubiquinone/menaquinone biosynthesis C-methylase UbiE